MSKQSALVLGVMAGVLGAFILFYERNLVSSTERAERSSSVFTEFVRDRVGSLEIRHGDGRVQLSRTWEEAEWGIGS